MDKDQQKQQSLISGQTLMAISAIIVSLCALGVSVYQAKIMRETQKATVWPFIEILPSNTQEGSSLGIYNKGTGPALIKAVTVSHENQYFKNWDAVFDQALDDETVKYTWSTVYGRVLAPNDVVNAIYLNREDAMRVGAILGAFSFEICYCSVYDDCWTTNLSRQTKTAASCEVDQENGFFQ